MIPEPAGIRRVEGEPMRASRRLLGILGGTFSLR